MFMESKYKQLHIWMHAGFKAKLDFIAYICTTSTKENIRPKLDSLVLSKLFNEKPYLFLSGTRAVIPIVGTLQDFSFTKLKLNKAEVCDVFVKSVWDLHHPKVAGYTQFRVPKSPGYSLPIYNCEPYPIWGMTAIITFQFLSVFLRGHRGFRHRLNYQTPFLKK